jgi:glycerol kinase
MEADSGLSLAEMRVDGGAAANDLMMQFQADILQVPVLRPKVLETTALGAAYLAGLAVGFWESQEEIARQWQIDRRYDPDMDADVVDNLVRGWRKALDRSRDWAESD